MREVKPAQTTLTPTRKVLGVHARSSNDRGSRGDPGPRDLPGADQWDHVPRRSWGPSARKAPIATSTPTGFLRRADAVCISGIFRRTRPDCSRARLVAELAAAVLDAPLEREAVGIRVARRVVATQVEVSTPATLTVHPHPAFAGWVLVLTGDGGVAGYDTRMAGVARALVGRALRERRGPDAGKDRCGPGNGRSCTDPLEHPPTGDAVLRRIDTRLLGTHEIPPFAIQKPRFDSQLASPIEQSASSVRGRVPPGRGDFSYGPGQNRA